MVIEECLQGDEISVLAFVDGDTVLPMLAVQDHKRAFDDDLGPNTGGMGAYCAGSIRDNRYHGHRSPRRILRPAVQAIRETGIPYRGVLCSRASCSQVDGPKCLEFNCRFGDPETQVLLPLTGNRFGGGIECRRGRRTGQNYALSSPDAVRPFAS